MTVAYPISRQSRRSSGFRGTVWRLIKVLTALGADGFAFVIEPHGRQRRFCRVKLREERDR
jgi:hypothetical protein